MFVRNPNALWTELDGQIMLMNVEKGAYYELVGIGGDIWRLLDVSRSEAEIVDQIVERYRVSRDQCLSDVRVFLEKLVAAHILSKQGSAGAIVE